MNLGGTVQATVGAVQLSTATTGWGVDLGSTTDAGASVLELSDAELDRITASAPLAIYARGTMTLSSGISPQGVNTLNLLADGAVLDANNSGPDVTVASLMIDAAAGIGMASNPLETVISTLEANGGSG